MTRAAYFRKTVWVIKTFFYSSLFTNVPGCFSIFPLESSQLYQQYRRKEQKKNEIKENSVVQCTYMIMYYSVICVFVELKYPGAGFSWN